VVVNLCEYVIEREKAKEQTGMAETEVADGRRVGQHLYRVSGPVQMLSPHLYHIVCTGWITSANEGSHKVQIAIFLVVKWSANCFFPVRLIMQTFKCKICYYATSKPANMYHFTDNDCVLQRTSVLFLGAHNLVQWLTYSSLYMCRLQVWCVCQT
jgi:hypothetical protein